jgi:methylglutamate dehydrogenase subunit D
VAELQRTSPSALAALVAPGRYGLQVGTAGLVVRERLGFALAHMTARGGQEVALAEAVQAHFGFALPPLGKRTAGAALTLAGLGPGQWLAEMPVAPADGIETVLRDPLGSHATMVDQSHARIILRLEGPRVRDVLTTGVPLDLHPRAFKPGDVAQTIVAHIGVQIWQIVAAPVYELAVPRSLIGSFWSWLEHAALRHGLDVRPAFHAESDLTRHGETPQ